MIGKEMKTGEQSPLHHEIFYSSNSLSRFWYVRYALPRASSNLELRLFKTTFLLCFFQQVVVQ